jgi:hypothetical protein
VPNLTIRQEGGGAHSVGERVRKRHQEMAARSVWGQNFEDARPDDDEGGKRMTGISANTRGPYGTEIVRFVPQLKRTNRNMAPKSEAANPTPSVRGLHEQRIARAYTHSPQIAPNGSHTVPSAPSGGALITTAPSIVHKEHAVPHSLRGMAAMRQTTRGAHATTQGTAGVGAQPGTLHKEHAVQHSLRGMAAMRQTTRAAHATTQGAAGVGAQPGTLHKEQAQQHSLRGMETLSHTQATRSRSTAVNGANGSSGSAVIHKKQAQQHSLRGMQTQSHIEATRSRSTNAGTGAPAVHKEQAVQHSVRGMAPVASTGRGRSATTNGVAGVGAHGQAARPELAAALGARGLQTTKTRNTGAHNVRAGSAKAPRVRGGKYKNRAMRKKGGAVGAHNARNGSAVGSRPKEARPQNTKRTIMSRLNNMVSALVKGPSVHKTLTRFNTKRGHEHKGGVVPGPLNGIDAGHMPQNAVVSTRKVPDAREHVRAPRPLYSAQQSARIKKWQQLAPGAKRLSAQRRSNRNASLPLSGTGDSRRHSPPRRRPQGPVVYA